jgi:MoaA/NifB/PqqE/SkfB family radical SAM enzyme
MKLEDLVTGLEIAAANPGSFLLSHWHRLATGQMGFSDFLDAVRRQRQLTYLTIDTTGACDLKCTGMCYYNPDISLGKNPVEESLLRKAISQAATELSLRVLTFAGKEPFLNAPRLFSLAKFAGSIQSRNYMIGIVTNGRHVARYRRELVELTERGNLDYVDISIDNADPVEHDRLRGIEGTHQLAVEAVLWMNQELPGIRTTVPSVLRRDNSAGILQLISLLASSNRHFQIQPIQPPPGSPFAPLAPEHILKFLEDLIAALEGPMQGAGIEVSVELLGIYLLEVVQRGIFAWSEIQEDENNILFVERSIGGNTLVITCEIFPLQAWRLARVMYNGTYLAHMHFLQSKNPEAFAVGSLQESSIVELFDMATTDGSHFCKVIESRRDHACSIRPCWKNCFGGWNGAENAFLEKSRKLTDQPRLCIKGEAEFAKILSIL